MNRQQWLEWRRGGIGSSDAPIIMGVSPWCTPHQLWERIILRKETESNYAMDRGTKLEEPARQCFERLMDVELFPKNVQHKSRPWMRASLDGIDIDEKIMVEIKCPLKKENHELAKQGKVPELYYPQVQHQLEVTGLDGMYYFSFDGKEGVIVEVERDQKYIDQMVQEEETFWGCVSLLKPPPLSPKDHLDFESNSAWRSLVESYKSVNEQKKQLEEQFKDLTKQEELIKRSLIDFSNGLSAYGCGIRLTKIFSKRSSRLLKDPRTQWYRFGRLQIKTS
jgi:putative phage-type endonuclease